MTDLSKKPENVDTSQGYDEETRKFHHIEGDISKELTLTEFQAKARELVERILNSAESAEHLAMEWSLDDQGVSIIAQALEDAVRPYRLVLENIKLLADDPDSTGTEKTIVLWCKEALTGPRGRGKTPTQKADEARQRMDEMQAANQRLRDLGLQKPWRRG